jgi:hypothetical protein
MKVSYYHDECLENWKNILELYGFIDVEIHYSGFGSQGDGAVFDFTNVDIEKFLKEIHNTKFKSLRNAINSNAVSVTYYSYKNNFATHYQHEKTRETMYDYYIYTNIGRERDIYLKQIDELAELIEKERLELCGKIYAELEDTYESYYKDTNDDEE